MTTHRGIDIKLELAKTLREINTQIEKVQVYARDVDMTATDLRDANGGWTYTPLLVAKAQVLHALVLVNQK